MKIAFIGNTRGGMGTYTQSLVNKLATKIDQIDVYLIEKPKFELKFPKNVRVFIISQNIYFSFIKTLFYIKKFSKYDLIHTNYAIFGLTPYLSKKIYHTPYLYEAHGYPQYWLEKTIKGRAAYYVEYLLAPIIARYANYFTTVSYYNRKLFIDHHGVDSKVMYHGMDKEKFSFNKNIRNKVRSKLGIGSKSYLVLYAGYFTICKDPLTFVNAIPFVLKNYPNTKFLMKGNGDLYDQIMRRIKELGIEKSVSVQDFSRDIENYLSASDLFVLSSKNEMFGFITAEALACGLPVIGSDGGATPEVIGDVGMIFKFGDHKDLSRKIVYLIENKNLMDKLKKEGPRRVKTLFNLNKISIEYLKLYNSMINPN